MKKSIILLASIFFIISCGEKKPKTSDRSINEAVCIWDGASLRQGPSSSTKWLSSVSFGEKVILLGEIQTDSTENIEFSRVKLSDGKEGWMSFNLIIPNGKIAAITEKTVIYNRPDLLTSTDKSFNAIEMIVITSESKDWLEVTGNQKKKSGWIKNTTITDSSLDVSVAILATKALEITDHEKRMEEINKIINNSDLQGSIFIPILKKKIDPFKVKKIIQVNTVKEFYNAFGSNRRIEITANKLILSELDEYNPETGGYNGYEFVIAALDNVIIAGANPEPTRLILNQGYGNVLTLSSMNKIALINLVLGHENGTDECEESSVISIINSKDIFIKECDLFGCGNIGLELYETKNLIFENSIIRECTYRIISAEKSNNITFEKSIFRNNTSFHQFNFYDCNDISFNTCEIYENNTGYVEGQGYVESGLFYLNENSAVDVTNCLIVDNLNPYYVLGEGELTGSGNDIYDNTWDTDSYEDEGDYYEEDYYDEGDVIDEEDSQYY